MSSENLFFGDNEIERAKELTKLMMVAGIDINEINDNSEMMESVANLIASFNPNKQMTAKDNRETADTL